MLIIALVLAVIGLAALVTAVVTSNEVIAWVCIGASVIGVLLLIVDALRERSRGADEDAERVDTDETDEETTSFEATSFEATSFEQAEPTEDYPDEPTAQFAEESEESEADTRADSGADTRAVDEHDDSTSRSNTD